MILSVYLDRHGDRPLYERREWQQAANRHAKLREATDMELSLALQHTDEVHFHPQLVMGMHEPLVAYWQEGRIAAALPLAEHAEILAGLAETLGCTISDSRLQLLYAGDGNLEPLVRHLRRIAPEVIECRENNRRRFHGAPTVKLKMKPAETFKDLRIPFPLFAAPAADAREYTGVQQCALCGEPDQHCFHLGIGSDLILPCPACGTRNPLDADDAADVVCRACGAAVEFPPVRGNLRICYSCLRTGKAAISRDSELGLVSYATAADPAGKLTGKDIQELLRTPTYASIQGERWLFCCDRPMIFAGEWEREDFIRNAPDGDGRTFFHQVVEDAMAGLWEDQLHDVTGIYVFQCQHCRRLRAHWDIA